MTNRITVVGLGAGDLGQLTMEAYDLLMSARGIYFRTKDHPMADKLTEKGVSFTSFDPIYERHEQFEQVYEAISQELVKSAANQDVVYAVPGHPMVAEKTVQLLREKADAGEIELRIIGGQSFLDQMFVSLGLDPVDGFQLLDGTDLFPDQLSSGTHIVVTQVYDSLTASEVKLSLMELFPDDYSVYVCHKLGFKEGEQIKKVPLYELDHDPDFGNYSLVYVPKATDPLSIKRSFLAFRNVIRILRSPEGCPWDREQTHISLKKYLLEEAYEVLEAIDDGDPDALCEELGDLLLQVLLHSQIAEEASYFNVMDVIQGVGEKMIRRHPHVFQANPVDTVEEVMSNWQEIKQAEKAEKGISESTSVLAGIPKPLPALMKAVKLQKKAAQVGFDWNQVEEIYDKVEEELTEMKQAQGEEQIDELGDLLFSVVNVARFLKIDPEEALTRTNSKFIKRFEYIEKRLKEEKQSFQNTSIDQMEQWWTEAKLI
jgi:tetrapyrrole methylase family protein/MazG family protein